MRLLLAVAIAVCSCNDFDCYDVSLRLFNDCGLVFGLGSGVCGGFYADGVEAAVRRADLNGRFCEIAEPVGEEQCYLTESCGQIASGVCASKTDPMPVADCKQACT